MRPFILHTFYNAIAIIFFLATSFLFYFDHQSINQSINPSFIYLPWLISFLHLKNMKVRNKIFFGGDKLSEHIGNWGRCIFNPFFEVTGIIASTWFGAKEIQNDFINAIERLLLKGQKMDWSRFVGSAWSGEKDISGGIGGRIRNYELGITNYEWWAKESRAKG